MKCHNQTEIEQIWKRDSFLRVDYTMTNEIEVGIAVGKTPQFQFFEPVILLHYKLEVN